MLLDEKRKKLFDKAYGAYIAINKKIEELYGLAVANPFEDERPSIIDVTCEIDLYLQGVLLKVAAADGQFTATEKEFIISLPDELDEVCARNKGYRRFLRELSMKSYQEKRALYFDEMVCPPFIEYVRETDEEALEDILSNLQTLLTILAAADGNITDEKKKIITEILKVLRGEASMGGGTANAFGKNGVSPASKSKTSLTDVGGMDEALQELQDLVGLLSVKKEVIATINLLKINIMRREKGLPELQTSKHMVFTGQPGTGKTTVARIMAKIFKALGIVSKGHLVETDRAGMVAGYVGQTALKTAQVIKKAKGGVLFIDEAYSLTSEEGSNDFGKEAIDTLVKGMEDYRDDLVVIVAGYTEEMNRFINMNPGLRSRFNKYICFDNYLGEEMLEIFKGLCESAKFILSPEAEAKALDFFNMHQGDDNFGNARGVRNYFDRVVTAQATRILGIRNPSEEEFRTILEIDVA